MIKSVIDSLGVEISRLGFGAMRLPVLQDGSVDRKLSEELIRLSMAKGINYYDTAYTYLEGQSQTVLADMLSSYPRQSYFFANKIPFWLCRTAREAIDLFENQLAVCNTRYFDFYLCHALDGEKWEKIKSLKILPLLRDWKEKGRIRFLGFSFHGDYESFRRILDQQEWDFVQIQINYFDNSAHGASLLHRELIRRDIPCFVMGPVKGGLLSGPYVDNFIGNTPFRDRYSASQWALRWCISQPHMHVILSGMTTPEQIGENADLFSTESSRLSPPESVVLESICRSLTEIGTIQCTSCGYCRCPSRIPIRTIFGLCNKIYLLGESDDSREKYRLLGEKRNAGMCTRCAHCMTMCPQKLNIPLLLEKAHSVLST